MHSLVIIVINKVLYAWKLLQADLKHPHHTHEELTMWSDRCVNYLDLGNHSTVYMYIKSIISLYTLKTNSYICQFFLINLEKKTQIPLHYSFLVLFPSYSFLFFHIVFRVRLLTSKKKVLPSTLGGGTC